MRLLVRHILIVILSFAASSAFASFDITSEHIDKEFKIPVSIQEGWKYQAGDNLDWALPEYNDSSWINIEKTEYRLSDLPDNIFNEKGWFRLSMNVDSSMFNKTIVLDLRIAGAAEVFLNGKLVHKWGTIGNSIEDTEQLYSYNITPQLIKLGNKSQQVLAIRHVDYYKSEIYDEIGMIGFSLFLSEYGRYQEYLINFAKYHWGSLVFTFGVSLAIALLHLLIFAFFPSEKSNLWYTLFVLSQVLIMLGTNPFIFDASMDSFLLKYLIFKFGLIGTGVFSVIFVLSLFREKLPKLALYVAGAGLVMLILAKYITVSYIYIFTMLLFPINAIEIFQAFRKKKRGANIIIDGVLLAMLFFVYQMLADMHIIPRFIPFLPMYQEYLAGVLIIVITMSIFLAWRVGQTNKDLEKKLVEVKELSEKNLEQERTAQEEKLRVRTLEMENQRKDLELEEARKREALMKKLEDTNTELELMNKELIQTQAQLVQSEKMASLGMLTAGIAHEINNPIGVINSSQDTLASANNKLKSILEEDLNESYQENKKLQLIIQTFESISKTIKTAGERVAGIVKKMKSFAHLDEAELQKADIHLGIENTCAMLVNEFGPGIQINHHFDQDIRPFNFYPGQLNQVFVNVLLNARDAIEKEGEITIKTELENNQVVVSITDSGKGISSSDIDRIFDPGYTTKGVGVGTGLGLSICYNIIKDHQGTISIESEIKKGTTVTISLPYK